MTWTPWRAAQMVCSGCSPLGVQRATRSGWTVGQQFRQVAVTGDAVAVGVLLEDLWVGVADGDQLDVLRVLGDGAKVVGGDAPATDKGQADFAVGDGLGHAVRLGWG